jgi:Fumarylacetoacetate (FAA) hydrolase family
VHAVHEQEEHPTYLLREETLQLGPCISRHVKIICVGLNYRRHAQETGAALPTSPVLFPKYANSLAACGDLIPLPHTASQFDYEAELALVIGRRAKEVSEQEAFKCIFDGRIQRAIEVDFFSSTRSSTVFLRYSSRLKETETLILTRFLRYLEESCHARGCHEHSHCIS